MKLPFYRTREALKEYERDADARLQALINARGIPDRRSAHRSEKHSLDKVRGAFFLDATPMLTRACSEMLSIDLIRYVVELSE